MPVGAKHQPASPIPQKTKGAKTMARKLNNDGNESGAVNEDGKQAKNMSRYKPYVGKEELPAPTFDKKGKVVKRGEMRYFLRGTASGKVKLLGVFRNGKGIGRILVRVLHPNRQNKPQDKAMMQMLVKQGITIGM